MQLYFIIIDVINIFKILSKNNNNKEKIFKSDFIR